MSLLGMSFEYSIQVLYEILYPQFVDDQVSRLGVTKKKGSMQHLNSSHESILSK
jgi:hypothetical protein